VIPPNNFVDKATIPALTVASVEPNRAEFWVIIAAAVAFVLKLFIAFNTIGTNDVVMFHRFGHELMRHGLEWTYRNDLRFNHPPLIAYFLRAICALSDRPFAQESGLTFPFLLRLPGIIADLIVFVVLLRMRQGKPKLHVPVWALLVFALSPVSLMVSGFHGNTDPIMVMFLVFATFAGLRNQPVRCGLFFALSCQIKVVPVLFLPILIFFWFHRRALLSFLIPLSTTTLVCWGEPLFTFPIAFARNVLSYGSFWGMWGITFWLRETGWSEFSRASFFDLSLAQDLVMTTLKLIIVSSVIVLAWCRRASNGRGLIDSFAYAWLIFFVFAPGIGAQYMVWLAPFILILSPQFYVYLLASSSLFLFFFYNTINRGLPWYLGISEGNYRTDWVSWSVCPWAVLLAGMVMIWKSAAREVTPCIS
jgi:hypothetical protein